MIEFCQRIDTLDGLDQVSIKITKRAEYYAQHEVEVNLPGKRKFKTTLGKLEALGACVKMAVGKWGLTGKGE